jgi:hypothetical protein
MINRPVPEVEVAVPMEVPIAVANHTLPFSTIGDFIAVIFWQVFMRMTTNIYSQSHIFAMQNLDREFDKELNQW